MKVILEEALDLVGDMEIYEIFYILRRRLEINQSDIAKQTKIQCGLLSMFERGTIILPDDDIKKLLHTIKEIMDLKIKEREADNECNKKNSSYS